MNLILFIHQEASRQGEALQKKMAEYFGENIIQLVHTFNALTYILKQTRGGDLEVYVLLAESPRCLQELFCLIDLICSMAVGLFWFFLMMQKQP